MIKIWINNQEFSQKELDAWKKQRIKKACKVLNIKSTFDDIELLNKELTDFKMKKSYEELINILKWRLLMGKWSMKIMSSFFKNQRKISTTTIIAEHLTAKKLSEKLDRLMLINDDEYKYVNLSVYPEHYVLLPHNNGQLEVIETTGNAPLPTQFYITFNDESNIKEPRDLEYPFQSTGTAKLKDGTIIGGVRHQFKDIPNGVEMKLLVEFPYLCPRSIVKSHQKHLAVEFSNWVKWILESE